MRIFGRQERESIPSPEPRLGLTREQLNEEFGKLATGSALSEDFMDGELWPTEGLTDRQIELLTKKLRKVRDKV